jgi:hypothetical protein
LRPIDLGFFGSLFGRWPISCLLTKTLFGFIGWVGVFFFFIFNDLPIQQSIANAEQILLPEYSIKAAFLYNFGKFVEWPAISSTSTNNIQDSFFNVCILGEDPFGEGISAINGKPLHSRTIRITYAQSVEHMDSIKKCDLLFICRSEEKHLPKLLESIKNSPILTVADMQGAAQLGVMINLIRVNDSVRFEINLNSAKQAGIKISSQLLKIATSVLE